MLAQALIAEADAFVALRKELKLPAGMVAAAAVCSPQAHSGSGSNRQLHPPTRTIWCAQELIWCPRELI
jgi:hypothetical protein